MDIREGNEQSSFVSTHRRKMTGNGVVSENSAQKRKEKSEIFFRTRTVFTKADIRVESRTRTYGSSRVRCAFNERRKTIGC